jgi:hypothetical protein
MERFRVSDRLAGMVLDRLGIRWPSSPAELEPVYRAWCARVPFDNISKSSAIVAGDAPPGSDPVATIEQYLATGLGGTCWAHVGALAAVLGSMGFRARICLEHMRRTGSVAEFHASVLVQESGQEWLLDPVWVSGRPLVVAPGARGDHAVIKTGLDGDGDRLCHWGRAPGVGERRYAVLSTVLDRDDVRSFCAVSGRFSGVPATALSFRRVTPTGTESLHVAEDGRTLVLRTRDGDGYRDQPFTDRDAAFAAVGCTAEARRRAERAGLLGGSRPL